ncbi:MAG: OmpA family protein [Deltaproteobacteria bacterium]|nr:OmpA family protein [Deltaproteobacteria bacterium]
MRTNKRQEEKRPRVIIKKVHARHAGHSGGAWKVAYADFVTAMMALFIILWVLAASDNSVRTGLAQYFRDPGIFQGSPGILPHKEGGVGDAKGKTHPLEELQGRLTREIQDSEELASLLDQISFEMTSEGLKIELRDKENPLFFDLSSAELRPVLLKVLEKIVRQLSGSPHRISIGGHTDARPFQDNSFYSNWELSAARALNARRAMERFGLGQTRVEKVTGHADQSLAVPKDPLDPANRRITIIVLQDQLNRRSITPDSLPSSGGLPPQ